VSIQYLGFAFSNIFLIRNLHLSAGLWQGGKHCEHSLQIFS